MMPNANLGSLLEAAVDIANARVQLLGKLREALLRHDDGHALHLARQLTGIDPTSCIPVLGTGRKPSSKGRALTG
jgi:hypothetical protein